MISEKTNATASCGVFRTTGGLQFTFGARCKFGFDGRFWAKTDSSRGSIEQTRGGQTALETETEFGVGDDKGTCKGIHG